MDDKDKLRVVEQALARMLKPLKGVPFTVIVKALADKSVVAFDKDDARDQELLRRLNKAIRFCAEELAERPIQRPRPNEVGNDVEPYVMRALARADLKAARPTSTGGAGKSTGYPDILVHDAEDRPTYLECKVFAHGKPDTTMRSFYLSPSETFKVSLDARHLLLAFGMERRPIRGSVDASYRPKSYKLIDLAELLCDVKYEFNSDNRRLYDPAMILSQGTF